MTLEHDSRQVSAALRGDAEPETLAGLVDSSRRMRLFWPVLAASPEPLPPGAGGRRRPGLAVSAGAVSVVAGMAEYGD
ncbi:hypothetical protein ACIQGZ_11070 [Streptomyces sp. NPDC092296]|uniref:hypothetical protein n=1 Tax=Streptomyces sp. NPDC092296 TaxID=3366012 RepID=UPI003806D268